MNTKKKMVKLGGVDIEVVESIDPTDDTPEGRLLCAKFDPNHPGLMLPHEIHPCGVCKTDVICSPNSPKNLLKICSECAMVEIKQQIADGGGVPALKTTSKALKNAMEIIQLTDPNGKETRH